MQSDYITRLRTWQMLIQITPNHTKQVITKNSSLKPWCFILQEEQPHYLNSIKSNFK